MNQNLNKRTKIIESKMVKDMVLYWSPSVEPFDWRDCIRTAKFYEENNAEGHYLCSISSSCRIEQLDLYLAPNEYLGPMIIGVYGNAACERSEVAINHRELFSNSDMIAFYVAKALDLL